MCEISNTKTLGGSCDFYYLPKVYRESSMRAFLGTTRLAILVKSLGLAKR